MLSTLIDKSKNQFQQLKTRNKILVGFSAPLLLMIVVVFIVYINIQKTQSTAEWVKHTHKVISSAQELSKLMVDMETGERGFLITGKEKFLEPFIKSQETWDTKLLTLQQTVSDNPQQVERLEQIKALEQKWQTEAAIPEINARRKVQTGNKSLSYIQNVLRKKRVKNTRQYS